MTPELEFSSLSNPEEAERLEEILSQCFNFSEWQTLFSRIGWHNFRLVRAQGQVVAGLGIHYMGQWFGGQSIPIAGLTVVGVAPEHRGRGVAAFLITETLQELARQGVPISTLYASTSTLYRSVGYEQAGNAGIFALPLSSITSSDRLLPIHRVEPSNHEVFHDLYRQRAIITNGNLDRNQAIWERVVQPQETVVYAYLVGTKEQPQGYMIFSQKPEAKGYSLLVRDLVALTPAAVRSIWTFFAAHRSLAEQVQWRGPIIDPLLSLLPEQTYRVVSLERWLLRIVNLATALEKRGYPVGLEVELHLAVRDKLLPKNNGNFILKVSQGQGKVTQGGRGELQLDIRGLSPLYTGLFTPQQLQSLGQIEATANALSAAAQIFAGSEPWLADHF